jgi:hypothetical protein
LDGSGLGKKDKNQIIFDEHFVMGHLSYIDQERLILDVRDTTLIGLTTLP